MRNVTLELVVFAMIVAIWVILVMLYKKEKTRNLLNRYFWIFTLLPILINLAHFVISMSENMPNVSMRDYYIYTVAWVVLFPVMNLRGLLLRLLFGQDMTFETWKQTLKCDYVFWCIASVPFHFLSFFGSAAIVV
jgi:4-amino-4-deoxy-L-arabinose transferase-like glycosyltransferase